MPNFPQTQAKARAQIRNNGQLLAYAKPDSRNYNPVDGDFSPEDTTEQWEAWTLVLPFNDKSKKEFDEGLLEGVVRHNTRFLLIAPETGNPRPTPNTIVTFEGTTWTVLGCNVLAFQETDVLYKAVMKK